MTETAASQLVSDVCESGYSPCVPNGPGETWKLMERAEVVGVLTVTGSDQPWLQGTFEAFGGFDRWRAIFVEENRIVQFEELEDHDVYEMWEKLVEQILGGLRLVDSEAESSKSSFSTSTALKPLGDGEFDGD